MPFIEICFAAFLSITILGNIALLLEMFEDELDTMFSGTKFAKFVRALRRVYRELWGIMRGPCNQNFLFYTLRTLLGVIAITSVHLYVAAMMGAILIGMFGLLIFYTIPRDFYNHWKSCKEECEKK